MAEALALSMKPKRKDINKYRELDDEWYSLGTELEFEDEELEELEQKYTNPHRRIVKIFDIWLKKGGNPTYRKLIKALVNIDKKDVAQSLCTDLGLISSLDSLLDTASQANCKLSEFSPIPVKEANANTDTPTPLSDQSSQKTTLSEHVQIKLPVANRAGDQPIPLTDSSYQEQVKDDSAYTTDTTEHSEDKRKMSLTDLSPKKSVTHDANVHSTEPHQIMLHYNDKLITALSLDPKGISRVLLAKGLIPEHTEAQMQQSSTSCEKATILVTTVRQVVKIAPEQFHVFLDILSNQAWTKSIMKELLSHISPTQLRKDVGVQAVNTGDHDSTDKEYKSSSDTSSNGEDHTFPELNSQNTVELEAQLILNADSMRKKFASLLVNVINSFHHQGIDPRRLASTILALTEHDDPTVGKPLLERHKEALMKAQTVDHTFDVLRPHMTFFNYEILEFLIEEMGSPSDKHKLQKFLQEFRRFCRRSVFEIPPNVLGHSAEKIVDQQKFCVKITKQFKAALLMQPTPLSSSAEDREGICAPELGISLEDAKHIQRKLASVLKLKVSSIYLDSVSSGSTILIFLLPSHISLTCLDSEPDIIALLSSGIHILCGPPGKPEPKELTSNGLVVHWSRPEYGCNSLAQYVLYYQKECEHEKKEWQEEELTSLETHACINNLDDGDTYVVKICTVSDVGTKQYSSESDPIVWSYMRLFTQDAHQVISRFSEMLILMLSSNNIIINEITTSLLNAGIILKEVGKQISHASTPNEKAKILVDAVRVQMQLAPEKFAKLVQILSDHSPMYTMNIVETVRSEFSRNVRYQYTQYLRWLYASLQSKDQSSSDQWPPSASMKFFRLAMIQTTTVQRGKIEDKFVQMTITGKVDDILRQKYPIKLENIFKATRGQRKVILLEGAPGCGKSTLSVYICQQWEKGQLFNQFKLVILIRLRDPAVKNAKCLADLLPCPNAKTAQLLAGIMMKCQDMLFILDGWDELPSNFRKKSIFSDLVSSHLPSSNPLSESTVIVTSRPIASSDLHQVVSSRIEILGFTAEELHQFFTECLKGDTEAVNILLEKIEENPEVAGSCYLPLNATILVHLFKSDRYTLPTTLYGIFSSLVLNCIKHHLKLCTQYKDVSIESLDHLPEFAKKPFSVLCRLAYDGVMEDKIIFTALPADVNTLSLLQGVESFIGREKAVSHNFLHLSIQELLAAWYIATQLPASEQVSKFNELFNKSRFSVFFRFYAAITKLRTAGIKDVVINVVDKHSRYRNNEHKVLMVSLLHCLYEAQDPSLCESIVQQLQHGLDLSDITLTPSDCLCIGYFLAHVCKMVTGEFNVDLNGCRIGDQGCKYLVSGLHKYLDTHSAVTTLLSMGMNSNAISHHGVHHLSTLLKICCINTLNLAGNDLASKQDAIYGSLAKQLKNNTTLKHLWLPECGLNSQSAESLAEALTTNKHLELLNVSENALCDDAIQHLAHALRVNQGLKKLMVESCGMTDVGVECLAKSLQYNNILTELFVYNISGADNQNRLTKNIVPLLTECLQNNHTLTRLELPRNLESSRASIEKAVNDVRKRRGLPLFEVEVFEV